MIQVVRTITVRAIRIVATTPTTLAAVHLVVAGQAVVGIRGARMIQAVAVATTADLLTTLVLHLLLHSINHDPLPRLPALYRHDRPADNRAHLALVRCTMAAVGLSGDRRGTGVGGAEGGGETKKKTTITMHFAKLYTFGAYQMLVTLENNDDTGEPEIRFTTDLEELRPTMALTFDDHDKCKKKFDEIDEETARNMFNQLKAQADSLQEG